MYWGDYCANGVMKSASAGKKVTLVLPKKDMDLKELLEYRYKTPTSQFVINIDTGYGVTAPGAPPPEETAATLAQVVKETSEATLNTGSSTTLSDEKKFPWGWVIGGVAVIGLGVGGYLLYKNSKK